MATQGIVTLMSKGKVLMKIVAGCDGMNAKNVGNDLKKYWPVSAKDAEGLAQKNGFGCDECLVVMTETEVISNEESPLPLYREKFQDPNFNPRWEHGSADHVVIIEV